MKKLDESKPYGITHGDLQVAFKQDGYDFDFAKNVISGSGPKDANVESVAKAVEKVAEKKVPKVAPLTKEQKAKVTQYMEGSTIMELKKFAGATYDLLGDQGAEFTKVAGGKGMKLRLAEFLARHIDNGNIDN